MRIVCDFSEEPQIIGVDTAPPLNQTTSKNKIGLRIKGGPTATKSCVPTMSELTTFYELANSITTQRRLAQLSGSKVFRLIKREWRRLFLDTTACASA